MTKRLNYFLLGTIMLSAVLGLWNVLGPGIDAIGAFAWSISDVIFADDISKRGWGTFIVITLFTFMTLLVIWKHDKNKKRLAALPPQILFGFILGVGINFATTFFQDTIDINAIIDVLPGEFIRTMIRVGLTVGLVISLAFAIALLLEANLINSAADKLVETYTHYKKIKFNVAKIVFDLINLLVALAIIFIFGKEVTHFIGYGTILALILTGPFVHLFLHRLKNDHKKHKKHKKSAH